jgi:hypothetical protein
MGTNCSLLAGLLCYWYKEDFIHGHVISRYVVSILSANSFVQISRNCKPSPAGTYKRRNLRNSYGSGMRSWRIAHQHERHRNIKVSSSTGSQCQFIGTLTPWQNSLFFVATVLSEKVEDTTWTVATIFTVLQKEADLWSAAKMSVAAGVFQPPVSRTPQSWVEKVTSQVYCTCVPRGLLLIWEGKHTELCCVPICIIVW